MDYYECIQKSIEYIEENIKNNITVGELAYQAGFSPYHYYRVFHAYMGMPVMEYVRKRRFTYAIADLAAGRKLIDIALDYGFDTHAGFTKAFKKVYGISPNQYRNHPIINNTGKVNLMQMSDFNIIGGIVMEPKILLKPSFKVIGYEFRTTLSRKTEDISAAWRKFQNEDLWKVLYEKVRYPKFAILELFYSHNMENDELPFSLCIEVDSFDSQPDGLFCAEFPSATYAMFTTPPAGIKDNEFAKAIQGTWDYIYKSWFPASGYEFDWGKADFGYYDERSGGKAEDLQIDIYIPVIKKRG